MGGGCAGVWQADPRFDYVVSMIRKNVFGWSDFFDPLCDSITVNGDYYLLANDFPSYIEAQVPPPVSYFASQTNSPLSVCAASSTISLCRLLPYQFVRCPPLSVCAVSSIITLCSLLYYQFVQVPPLSVCAVSFII